MKITYELSPTEVEVLALLSQYSHVGSLEIAQILESELSFHQLVQQGFIRWSDYEGWQITDFGRKYIGAQVQVEGRGAQ